MGKTSWAGDVMTKRLKTRGVQPALAFLSFSTEWRWLIPNMSYRGRALVVNNLVAFSSWHRLACADPPVLLLDQMQAILVDFFWDNLHWVQQSVLYLPKDEGGQGLIHLQTRSAAFRSQFLRRLFDGASDFS